MSTKSIEELSVSLAELREKEAKFGRNITEWSKDLEKKSAKMGEDILAGADLVKVSGVVAQLKTQIEAANQAVALLQKEIIAREAELQEAKKAEATPRLEAIEAEGRKLQVSMGKTMQELLSTAQKIGEVAEQEKAIMAEFGLNRPADGPNMGWNSAVDSMVDFQMLVGPSFKDQVFIRVTGNRIMPVAFYTQK